MGFIGKTIVECGNSAISDDFSGVTLLKEIPRDLRVIGNLRLDRCAGLSVVHPGLAVRGDLHMMGCTAIGGLPEGLAVAGSLWLDGTIGVRLPESFLVRSDNPAVFGVLKDAFISCNLDLSGNDSITELPSGMVIVGGLRFNGCGSLTALPEGIVVGETIIFNACPRFRSLPKGMRVRSVMLRECPAWDGVEPDGATILGMIHTDESPNGRKLHDVWASGHQDADGAIESLRENEVESHG
jgi:hypothetical protein